MLSAYRASRVVRIYMQTRSQAHTLKDIHPHTDPHYFHLLLRTAAGCSFVFITVSILRCGNKVGMHTFRLLCPFQQTDTYVLRAARLLALHPAA